MLDRFSECQQRHGENGGGQQVDRQAAPRLRNVALADLRADGSKRRESEPEAETRAESREDALAKGADVYITGDIYYHTAQDMLSDGLLALDPGHHIEVLFVSKLVEKLNQWKAEEAWEIEVIGSQASTNPFYHI